MTTQTDKLAAIESELLTLTPGEMDRETFASLWCRMKAYKQALAELEKHMKDVAIWDIEARKEPIVVGDGIELTLGYPPKHKSRDNAETLDALLEFSGGDIAAVAENFLCSEPFKFGAIKASLGESKASELFETIREPKVVEGQAKQQLQEINKNFIK